MSDIYERIDLAVEEAADLLADYMRAEGATSGEVEARLWSLLYRPLHGLASALRNGRGRTLPPPPTRVTSKRRYPPGDPGPLSVRCDPEHQHDARCGQDEIGDWWQTA